MDDLGKVYLAARYTRRLELCGYRDELACLGVEVTSRWLNGSHQLDNEGRPLGDTGELQFEAGSPQVDHFRHKFATDDLDDVIASRTLIAFTEEPRSGNSRGGRHVELGIALGTGKQVIIIGPRENVFCWLPWVEQHETWADFRKASRPVDMGFMSLPADVQAAVDLPQGTSVSPTPDCGYIPHKPPGATECWYCTACQEFHSPTGGTK